MDKDKCLISLRKYWSFQGPQTALGVGLQMGVDYPSIFKSPVPNKVGRNLILDPGEIQIQTQIHAI